MFDSLHACFEPAVEGIRLAVGPTLPEQVLSVELNYYHQINLFSVTAEDEAAWQQRLALHTALRSLGNDTDSKWHHCFARFVLERHGYLLHQYMAQQLSPEAWAYWFAQGGLLVPFRLS